MKTLRLQITTAAVAHKGDRFAVLWGDNFYWLATVIAATVTGAIKLEFDTGDTFSLSAMQVKGMKMLLLPPNASHSKKKYDLAGVTKLRAEHLIEFKEVAKSPPKIPRFKDGDRIAVQWYTDRPGPKAWWCATVMRVGSSGEVEIQFDGGEWSTMLDPAHDSHVVQISRHAPKYLKGMSEVAIRQLAKMA